jgi:hypothetical protein
MKDINFNVPETEYKEKPRAPKQRGKFLNFLSEQKYAIFACIAFIMMVTGEIWSMKIESGTIDFKEVTFQVILYAIFYYLVFFFMTGQGREKGRRTPVYLDACSDYDTIHEKMYNAGLVQYLQDFCRWKRDAVIKEMQQAIMLDSSMSWSEYVDKWQNKPRSVVMQSDLDKQTKDCVLEANAFKTPKLTASMLWEKTSFNEQVTWLTKSGKSKLVAKRIRKAARVVLFATVSVAISYDTVTHFDLDILIDAFTCLLTAILGYLDGFSAYAVTETNAYTARTTLLSEAYDWAVEQKSKEKAE